MTGIPNCLFCEQSLAVTFLDLGEMPLANSYIDPERANEPEPKYPLHARVCGRCFLVQVQPVVSPEEIFSNYAYFSSVSTSWVEHARRFAEETTSRLGLGRNSFVVEVASNDGYLLQHFLTQGTNVLGVEPAENVAAVAQRAGVPTVVEFFGRKAAVGIVSEHGQADLVCANNVLAHVPDINDFVAGLAELVAPTGSVTVEAPHLLRLMEGVQFDTIYHEHFTYLSLISVERILAAHHLAVFDVDELPTHGGSLRYWIASESARRTPSQRVAEVRDAELEAGLHAIDGYLAFAPKVAACRSELLGFLSAAAAEGRQVAGYGAAAKGNTLLNYCGITASQLPYVVDRSPHKQGKLLPGTRLPVLAPEEIGRRRPDHVLVLAWNLLDEIMVDMSHITEWGGSFVVPVPTVTVVG